MKITPAIFVETPRKRLRERNGGRPKPKKKPAAKLGYHAIIDVTLDINSSRKEVAENWFLLVHGLYLIPSTMRNRF